MDIGIIFELVNNLEKIILDQIPGFDVRVIQKINDLRTMYAQENAKPIDTIDAAKLDSIEFELCNQLRILSVALSGANTAAGSRASGPVGIPSP